MEELSASDAVQEYLKQRNESIAQSVKESLVTSIDSNPDFEAKIRRDALAIGVPVDTARNTPDETQRKAAIIPFDFDRIAKETPKTAEFISNQENARIAHDDIDTLASIEKIINRASLPDAPKPQEGLGFAEASKKLRQEQDAYEEQVVTQRFRLQGADERTAKNIYTGLNLARQALVRNGISNELADRWLVQQAMQPIATIKESPFNFDIRNTYKDSNELTRGITKGVAGLANQSVGLQQFVADTFGLESYSDWTKQKRLENERLIEAIGGGDSSFQRNLEGSISSIIQNAPGLAAGIVSGQEWAALAPMFVQTFGEEYANGVENNKNYQDAVQRATIYGAAEVVGEKFGLGDMLRGMKFASNGIPTKDLVPYFTKAIIKEIPGEQLTTALEFGTDKFLPQGITPEATLQDYLNQASDTLTQTILQSGIMVGGSVVVNKAAHAIGRKQEDVYGAMLNAKKLNDLTVEAERSKLRPRDTESFKEHVENVADNTNIKNVYIDATTLSQTLAQPGLTLDNTNINPNELNEAIATGGDLAIPLSEYLSTIAGTELDKAIQPYLRTDPLALNQAEAENINNDESIKQEVSNFIQKENLDSAIKESAKAVEDKIYNDLITRQSPDVSRKNAALVSSFYQTLSNRLNITPEEAFNQYPLRVNAQATGANTLDQSAFHGSPYKFDKFSLEHLGKGEGAQAYGHGLYFAGNKEVAEYYRAVTSARRPTGVIGSKYGIPQEAADKLANEWLDYQNVNPDELHYFVGDDAAGQIVQDILDGKIRRSNGQLYEVNIPEDDQFLLWDKTIAEQPERVRDALSGIGVPDERMDGKEIYAFVKELEAQKSGQFGASPRFYNSFSEAASKFLHSIGIAGIKYLDGSSRSSGEGNYNYVVFDDKAVEILNTFYQSAKEYTADTININGEEKPTTDSTGKRIAKTEEGLRNFWKWFGYSKVVDEQGRPLVVYHGKAGDLFIPKDNTKKADELLSNARAIESTLREKYGRDDSGSYNTQLWRDDPLYAEMEDILKMSSDIRGEYWFKDASLEGENFDVSRSGDIGVHFTPNKNVASQFAKNGVVYPVYLKAKNLTRVSDIFSRYHGLNDALNELEDRNVISNKDALKLKPLADKGDSLSYEDEREWGASPSVIQFWKKLNKLLSKNKDNAIIYNNEVEGGGDSYVVLNSEQIKSAIGNQGTFDPANPNILNQQERGSITFADDITKSATVINLLENSDLSTFLHESGHFFLEVYNNLYQQENAPPEIKQDFDKILEWFGITHDQWESMDLEGRRPYHEQFARGFEAYLFEGKSPSVELKAIFQRFSSWLLNVYKSLTSLNVQLTDEVRGVFDRMLASEEQIQEAEALRNHTELFKSAEEGNFTPEQFDAYKKLKQSATQEAVNELQERSLRDMKWLSNAKSRILKELQNDAKEKRKAIVSEVTKEVAQEPVNQSRKWLKTGEMTDQQGNEIKAEQGFKLNLDALKEMYPEKSNIALTDEQWKILGKGKYGMVSNDGLHPSIVAEMFGYPSADSLINDLLEQPSAKDKIEQLTDQRMLEKYGDINSPEALNQAVNEAIQNDAHIRFLATELTALDKSLGKKSDLKEAAKNYAEEMIGKKLVKELRPTQYLAAEARAAKNAETALKKGDRNEAASQKRKQILNAYATKIAYEKQNEIDKALRDFKKIFASDERLSKTRNIDIINAARAILDSHNLGNSNRSPFEYLEKIKEYDAQLHNDLMTMIGGLITDQTDYKQMSVNDFMGMKDVVLGLWYMSRRSKQAMIDGKLVDRETIINELNDKLKDKPANFTGGYTEAVGDSEKRASLLLSAKSALRRVEHWVRSMDGGTGPFRKYIWQPVSESITQYRTDKENTLKKFLEIIQPIKGDISSQEIYSPELNYKFKNMGEVFHALLHTGNESNLRKLLIGRGWGEDINGVVDTRKWGAFVKRLIDDGKLTKAHYDAAQGIWDLLESMKPLAQKVHHDLYGYYFKEVTANPVATPFGTYKGGYVPAIVDPSIVKDATRRNEGTEFQEQNNYQLMFPNGFTKSRVMNYNRPLLLDLTSLPSHIDKVLRFNHIVPAAKDVDRIIRNRSFQASLDAIDPSAIGGMLQPWLNRSVNQRIDSPTQGPGGKQWDKFWREVRKRTGLQLMTANVVNAAQQLTGFFPASLRVPPTKLLSSLIDYIRHPRETANAVRSKSEFMRQRTDSQSFEIAKSIDDIIINPTKFDTVRSFGERHGYFFQQAFQNVVDINTWQAAYDDYMSKANGDINDNEKEAVRHADATVRETQGSFAPEDTARFEGGSPVLRIFTQFYSFFNNWGNLLATDFSNAMKEVGIKKGSKLIYTYAMGFAIPAIIAELIIQSLKGDLWKDDEYADNLVQILLLSQLRAIFGMVPVVGQGAVYVLNKTDNKLYNDRLAQTPTISLAESSIGAPISIYNAIEGEGSEKKAIRDTLSLIGMSTGLPLMPLGRPLEYVESIK